MTTRNLWEEDDESIIQNSALSVNRNYANKYEERKKKEELSHLEEKYKAKLASKKGSSKTKNKAEAAYESESEGTEDEDDDVIEDEDGELVTPAVEAQILRTVAEIRARSDKIYDPSVKFFDEKNLASVDAEWKRKQSGKDGDSLRINKEDKKKSFHIKDYHRERLLKGRGNEESEEENGDDDDDDEEGVVAVKTHDDEQREILDEFRRAAQDTDAVAEEDDATLLRVKAKSEEELNKEDDEYRRFLLENLTRTDNQKALERMNEWFRQKEDDQPADENEQFLVNFILSRGWIDRERRANGQVNEAEEEEDEEAVERMEEFEEKYNFRFEQPGGDQIVTYARQVEGSMRRDSGKRKEQRAARKTRKEEEREKQRMELMRLKSLKKQEISEKLEKIAKISGNRRILDEATTDNFKAETAVGLLEESDFDPEEHDRRMNSLFGEDYYGEGDDGEDYENVEVDSEIQEVIKPIQNEDGKAIKKATKSLQKAIKAASQREEEGVKEENVNELLDQYYQLDYEDMIEDLPCRFKYEHVEPTTFGLKIRDILGADDTDLNAHVSLKKLAPYRDPETVKRDEERYGHKKRMYKFYDNLKKKRQSPVVPQDEETAESNSQQKKKRKRNK